MNQNIIEKTKPAKPRSAQITVAEYLAQQIGLCGKTQGEIAREAGFNKPNIITMLKQGTTKLPLAKIGLVARALEVDALYLFKLAMSEYEPDTWAVIMDSILKQPLITANEFEIIEVVRKSAVPNPKIRTDDEKLALLKLIDSLKPDNAVQN